MDKADRRRPSLWVLGGIAAALVVVAVGLFPTECLTRLKVPAADAVQGEEPPLDTDPVTRCETWLGVEWSSRATGKAVAVVTSLAALAVGLATFLAGKKKYAPG